MKALKKYHFVSSCSGWARLTHGALYIGMRPSSYASQRVSTRPVASASSAPCLTWKSSPKTSSARPDLQWTLSTNAKCGSHPTLPPAPQTTMYSRASETNQIHLTSYSDSIDIYLTRLLKFCTYRVTFNDVPTCELLDVLGHYLSKQLDCIFVY